MKEFLKALLMHIFGVVYGVCLFYLIVVLPTSFIGSKVHPILGGVYCVLSIITFFIGVGLQAEKWE